MHLLFTDQAEYYVVCDDCYSVYRRMQWSGSTHGGLGWQSQARHYFQAHVKGGKQCEFCGDNGNGGWMIDGHFYAAEKRDARKAKQ